MISEHAFLAGLLLASAAQVLTSPHLKARPAAGGSSQSRPVDRSTKYYTNWAGAVWEEKKETFTSVAGTFTVPAISGKIGAGASVWVGIDGDTCPSVILQTGVQILVGADSQTDVTAWHQWYPEHSHYFIDFDISVGDTIRAAVIAFNATSGVALVENLSTGRSVYEYLTSNHALCGQNAEWIVEDYTQPDGSLVPFGDFGTVIFSDAIAFRRVGAPYTPSGAQILDIWQGLTLLTSVSIDGDSVNVTYFRF